MTEDQGLLERSRREFERSLQRNIKGLGYFNSPAPVMGASEKDVLVERGTMRLYHYRPLTDEITGCRCCWSWRRLTAAISLT